MVGISRDEKIKRLLESVPRGELRTPQQIISILSESRYAYAPTRHELTRILLRIGLAKLQTPDGIKWRF